MSNPITTAPSKAATPILLPSVGIQADSSIDNLPVGASGVEGTLPWSVRIPTAAGSDADPAGWKHIPERIFREVTACVSNHEASELSRFNNLIPAGEIFKATPLLTSIVKAARGYHEATRGAFCMFTAGPAASACKPADIEISDAGIIRKCSGTLDLYGIAKGFAVDLVCVALAEAEELKGLPFVVEWAGDLRVMRMASTVGVHGCGSTVRVPISCAVATSGTSSGVVLSATVPPSAKVSVLWSSTVVAVSAAAADALATASLAVGMSVHDAIDARMWSPTLGVSCLDCVTLCMDPASPRRRLVVVRPIIPGVEDPAARAVRLSLHERATVVVVGGGLAGLCAAVSAADCGAAVTLLESEPTIGGNSAKATSGISAWGTIPQRQQGIADGEVYFERDVFASSAGLSHLGLVRLLSSNSASAVNWLMERFQLDLSVLSQLGGHCKKRTHRLPPRADGSPVPVGRAIINAISAAITATPALKDNIKIITNARVTELITECPDVDGPHVVHGVKYRVSGFDTVLEVRSDATVLATGGFSASKALLGKHRPDIVDFPTTNGQFARGDGLSLATQAGASLLHMDKVQLHPTGMVDPSAPDAPTKWLGPEALRGSGGVLLDQLGRRFVDELNRRDFVSQALLPLPKRTAWIVLGAASVERFGRPLLDFYASKGLMKSCETLAELATHMGVEASILQHEIRLYNDSVDRGVCDRTGKTVFPGYWCREGPYYVGQVTPSIHYCMGGVIISASTDVLQLYPRGLFGRRRAIPHLYAAGEVTGGVHGENRLGGTSLLECVVMGRLAGERAATIKQKNSATALGHDWTPVRLREVTVTSSHVRQLRFDFPGSRQISGLEVGQFVAITGEWRGESLQSAYSPITRPDDRGSLSILVRADNQGGALVPWLNALRPSNTAWLRIGGGPKIPLGKTRYLLLAGGTGVAPMVQIVRSALHDAQLDVSQNVHPSPVGHVDPHSYFQAPPLSPLRISLADEMRIRLIHAADTEQDLSFLKELTALRTSFHPVFDFALYLDRPPLGWEHGIGFIDKDAIRRDGFGTYAPDTVAVICGPPPMQRALKVSLIEMGFPTEAIFTYE